MAANEVYYTTRKSSKTGTGRIIYINRNWGFMSGDSVKVNIYPVGRPKDGVTVYKKISATGSGSLGVYLDRNWGFDDNELLVMAVSHNEKEII